MSVDELEWVTLEEASQRTKVPLTTIRDWYRSGAISATHDADGHRLVRFTEVEAQATGMQRDVGKIPSARLGPPAEHRPDAETVAAISASVRELQGLARERLEESSG